MLPARRLQDLSCLPVEPHRAAKEVTLHVAALGVHLEAGDLEGVFPSPGAAQPVAAELRHAAHRRHVLQRPDGLRTPLPWLTRPN